MNPTPNQTPNPNRPNRAIVDRLRSAGLALALSSACGGAALGLWMTGCAGSGDASPAEVSGTNPTLNPTNEVEKISTEMAITGKPPRATPPPPPANVVVSTNPWTYENFNGQVISTPYYRLYTTTERQQLITRLPLFLESSLLNYRTAITDLPPPADSMESYILANRPQWARLTQRLMGRESDVYLQIQRGGFASGGRAVLYDIGPRDTFVIAAHEGWHQYSQKTFLAPLPTTIEEGLATFMEGFRWDTENPGRPIFAPWSNTERFDQLRNAVRRGKLLQLQDLLNSTPQELVTTDADMALTYYAQGWAMIHYLSEGPVGPESGKYRGALEQMVKDASTGQLIDRIRRSVGDRGARIYAARRQGVDLLQVYTGKGAEEHAADYQAFVEHIVRTGAKARIVRGLSPVNSGD